MTKQTKPAAKKETTKAAAPKTKTSATKSASAVKKTVTKKAEGAKRTGGRSMLSNGTGRRKSSVARVWLSKGSGMIVVNGKDFRDYFDTDINRMEAEMPFRVAPSSSGYDVLVNVQGGGMSSQAGATKLGIARAMVAVDESLRPVLRSNDLLTVDSRVKERKKYGQKAARRKFQFVKR